MTLGKRYHPHDVEGKLRKRWQEMGVYRFERESNAPVFSVDTPPPTVSGYLHLGHLYSYSHADFIARFQRMRGCNVFYPMGYDDNGLATERLVEKRLGITAEEVGRESFVEACLKLSKEIELEYEAIWRQLGLSIDWSYTYSTIDELSRRTAQHSFIDLYRRGRVYRQQDLTIWCPECRTAIAQAEVDDLPRRSEYVTIPFRLPGGDALPIATTRPELLPACVAVFVHPGDTRYRSLVGADVQVPLGDRRVPVMEDLGVDPDKGTGAVMCCTFGDVADVNWWRVHQLPLLTAIDREGRMTAGEFVGFEVTEARRATVARLEIACLILDREPTEGTVRVHERCDTPVEYMVTPQWFIRILDRKAEFLQVSDQIDWHPPHMKTRFREWVQGLGWDWCISRQRYHGVPFPLWYCLACGEPLLASEDQLPLDPTVTPPNRSCPCGGTDVLPEVDVMDTWATSSLTPQIVGRWLTDESLYEQVFPMSVRAQAHDIIRTWAFDTIVQSLYHFDAIPWENVLISGWGLAPEGMGKISKSRGGGPMSPGELLARYSADAVRYWAAGTGPGRDTIISEERIQAGGKLVTKLWNVARFAERFLEQYVPPAERPSLTTVDRWVLSRLQRLIIRVTGAFESYDYAVARAEIESFFWRDLADNYLEMVKGRLYGGQGEGFEAAKYTLYQLIATIVKLFAPILPYVTEEIYSGLLSEDGRSSIHRIAWPVANESLFDEQAERAGEALLEVISAVRRYKSNRGLSLGAELGRIQLAPAGQVLRVAFEQAHDDIQGVTRAQKVEFVDELDSNLETILLDGAVRVAVEG